MKLKQILIEDVEDRQVKSYDKEYGKILLDVHNFKGATVYRYNNITHRNDGKPAIVWKNGVNEWYVDGELHREDGPAISASNNFGSRRWFLKGKKYTEEQWKEKVGK